MNAAPTTEADEPAEAETPAEPTPPPAGDDA